MLLLLFLLGVMFVLVGRCWCLSLAVCGLLFDVVCLLLSLASLVVASGGAVCSSCGCSCLVVLCVCCRRCCLLLQVFVVISR